MRRLSAIALILALGLSGTAIAAEGDADGAGQGKDTAASGESGDMSVQQLWQNAKEDWSDLQDATGEAWDRAKKEFDESWSALKKRLGEEPPSTANERPTEQD